jgi:RND family efflux transporter MFP subunit
MKIDATFKKPLFLILSVSLLCVPSGCKKQPPSKPEPPKVTVTTPVQQRVQAYYDYTGTIEAIEAADIRARVEGFLDRCYYEDGAYVNKGDLLFSIEKDMFKANVVQAQATLESKTAELKRAQSDYDRVASAVQSGAVSEQERDLKEAQRDVAKAAVAQAQAMLMQAQLQLDYTEVKTPIAGKISRAFVGEGNLVGSGEKTLLARVVRFDSMHAYFSLSETALIEYLKRVSKNASDKKSSKVKFLVSLDGQDYSHEGVIDYLDNELNPKTGTIQVRGIVPNDRNLLYPGMFVKIRIPSPEESVARLVFETAIGTDLGGKYVLVVGNDNIVERRYVKAGQLYGQMRAIEDGLDGTERYIFKGTQRARPGLPVTPVAEEPAQQDKTP